MSDKKELGRPAGQPRAFPSGSGAVRDAIPTADEGDALLDMLFDDAPRAASQPSIEPQPIELEPQPREPAPFRDAEATPIPGSEPPPEPTAPGTPSARDAAAAAAAAAAEVVSPPGWRIPAPSPRATAVTQPDAGDDDDADEVRTRAFTGADLSNLDEDSVPDGNNGVVDGSSQDALYGDDEENRMDATIVAPNTMLVEEQVALASDHEANAEDANDVEDAIAFSAEEFASEEPSYEAAADLDSQDAPDELPDLTDGPEEDATAVFTSESLVSLEAPPAPSSAVISARSIAVADLGDETEASQLLAETPGLQESFLERAGWMREEANLTTDKAKKARLLLTVSELFALAGDEVASGETALEANQLAPNIPLVTRQHRSLALRTGDLDKTVEVLELEARHAPTPDGRAHAAWFSSEIARIAQRDETTAKKRAEQALRALPTDPRPNVQRFVEAAAQLPDPGSLAKIKVSDAEALGALAQACTLVANLRGAPLAKGAAPRHVVEVAQAARTALGSNEPGVMVAGVSRLRDTSFREAASWLTALLAMSHDETRAQAVAALREVAPHAPLGRRMLAALSVETGDSALDRSSADSVDQRDPNAFSAVDRIALAALDAARPHPAGLAAREMLASIVDEAAVTTSGTEQADDVAYLTGPVIAALFPSGEQRLSRLKFVQAGQGGVKAAALLGRTLGAVRAASVEAHEAIDGAITELVQSTDSLKPEWSAFIRALGMELDIDSSAADRVAQAITTWGSDGERPADAGSMLIAALLAEIAREPERARTTYAEIHREDPSCEVVVRAAAGEGDAAAFARMLKEHAEQLGTENPNRRAILLTECAIRFASLAAAATPDSPEAAAFAEEGDTCAKAAAEGAPNIPIAVHLGEISARTRGDQEALVEWLRFRRESTADPIERAHDLTREALLVSDGESAAASSLLEEALRARTTDFGLRDLYERLSPDPTSDRATWREARIPDLPPREAARLCVEAALDYERSGDIEAASRCAKLAESLGEKDLAPIAAYRCALAGFGTAELVDALLPQARSIEEPELRLEIYERLAELDERGRNDAASALLFRRSILDENPTHTHTLRRVASALMSGGRTDEIEPIAMELARTLEGGEAVAYAALAARLRTRWEDTAEPVAIAYAQLPRPLWAIRQMAAHARARNDATVAAQCDRELMELTDRPAERATLALRAGQALRSGGDIEGARVLLEDAVSLAPDHLVARLELASVLEDAAEHAAAATQLETVAETVSAPDWKVQLLSHAATLWQDHVQDADKARAALERVVAIDPNNVEAFDRLRPIYVAAGARVELAELLGRRIETIQDPVERVEMEVMRGRTLAEVGDADAAKRALAAALDANPDHIGALQSFADLCFADADYEGAEQALIRLARLTSDPDGQVGIYMQLGQLYDELVPNEERAELAYQEVLKRRPSDEPAREKLIALYRRTSQMPRAIEEQNVLVNAAEQPEDKCRRTVELAEILEETGELKKAESTLVVARKAFPKSDLALRALIRFYQRTGQAPAAAIMLDRAVADARRALGTGRFETFLFETLATAAELRNRADAAAVAHAAVQAIEGQPIELLGVEQAAGDASLDELLAPEVMTPAFRDLLLRTGDMLDAAFPYDLDGVRATPAGPSYAIVAEEVRAVAGAYGLPQVQLLVSTVLGHVCIPARSHPPTIVMGLTLAAQESTNERTFLIHRAMKVLQANAAVFGRTAPIDLWPLLAAYLRVFSPQFTPQGVDAARFSEAFARLSRTLPSGLGHDTSLLATDVIASIGNRASTLNSAINGWGSRAGLLAVGDANVALAGIAWAGGNANGPPPSGKDRLTWIGRNAEARDLIIFSVSDAYVDARSRLGGQ